MARSDVLRSRAHLAWACVGGLLLAASGEPWSINAAGFASMGVFALSLERASERPKPLRAAAFAGLAFGATTNGIALYSLVALLEDFGHFPWVLAVLVAALGWFAQGVPYAIAGGLAELAVRLGMARFVALPFALVCALGFAPQLFPWHPGATQVDFTPFAQVADLGGEALLDLCVALVGCTAYQLWRTRTLAKKAPVAILVAALLVPCAYGALRLPTIRAARAAAPSLRIGVVQSNVPMGQKHDAERAQDTLHDLLAMTHTLEQRGADVTVWAETAYPYPLLRARAAQPTDERRIVGTSVRGPVLIGTLSYEPFGPIDLRYNSGWVVHPDGRLGDRVDKARLMPFGEFVPFWHWFPALQKRFPSPGLVAGKNDVVRVDGASLGILICYEDLFASLAKRVVDRGAEVLVNQTNDAWFGKSDEPVLHDMVARLRAIETRRDLVRAVNTGVSSMTLATGEQVTRTGTFERASFVADAKRLRIASPYTLLGDWVSPFCAAVLLGFAGVRFVRKRRPGRSGGDA